MSGHDWLIAGLGALWGFSVCYVVLWYWLIRPLGELLAFDSRASRSDADQGGSE